MYELNVPLRVMVGKKWFPLNLGDYRNSHYFTLNSAKKIFDIQIQNQLCLLPKLTKIKVHYEFFYSDKRIHDLNNNMSVVSKFFEDSLVLAKVIPDDNYLFIIGSSNSFGGISKDNPRCQITITEVTW